MVSIVISFDRPLAKRQSYLIGAGSYPVPMLARLTFPGIALLGSPGGGRKTVIGGTLAEGDEPCDKQTRLTLHPTN